MMKAYDRVEWRYLEAIMITSGIHPDFIHLIMRLVTTVSFSVLVNREGSEICRESRGIIEGDPISPYVFRLAAEVLSCLLRSMGTKNLSAVVPNSSLGQSSSFCEQQLAIF
jgi:hypothetical protein